MRPRLAAVMIGASLGACSLFGSSRPEPPPYPALTDANLLGIAWRNDSLGRVRLGFRPAIVTDSIWVASASGVLRRLARRTGQVELEVRLAEPLGVGVGADDTLVVVVSRNGDVIALDNEGQRRWSTPLKGEVVTVPAVADGVVVVRTVDGRIVALDRTGGSIRWTWTRTMPTLTLRQSSPLVVRDDTVYAGMPGARVVALDLRLGAPRWESVIATPRGVTELDRLVDIVGAPAVTSESICAIAYQGKLACLRQEDGRIAWSRDVSSSSGLSIADESVVTVDASDVIAAVRPTGDPKWKQDGYVRRGLTTPIVVGDRVLFGDRFGNLTLLSLADGTTLSRLAVDSTAFASPPTVIDGVAYAQTVGGTVVAATIR